MDAIVYIHGAVGEDYGPHTDDYEALRAGLVRAGVDLPPVGDSVALEWGWPSPGAGADGPLATAQSNLDEVLSRVQHRDRLTGWLMTPLRDLIMFAWSDAVYYAAQGGKEACRRNVWQAILARVPTDAEVDLTFVAHSAGALIAHDFLFHLFSGQRRQRREEYGPETAWREAEQHWRLRRLVTLGSPVAPLMVRSQAVMETIAAGPGPWLDPADIGLGRPSHAGPQAVWLNVWDRHDFLSFPAGGVYRPPADVRDLYPDVGDRPGAVHERYWRSRRVHRALAQEWDRPPLESGE